MSLAKITVTGVGEAMKTAWQKVNTFIDDYEAATNLGTHASKHTDGTDDIQNATAAQKGLATSTQISKLDGIEASADVTDAVNIASSIHGVSAKTTPVNADEIAGIDTENSNVLKKHTWTNIKAFLKTYFDTFYAASGVNADITSMTGLNDDGIPLAKVANALSDTATKFTAETELTIATGAITVTQMRHKVDTEADAASDDLVTINGGGTVNMIVLRAESDERTVVVKHGTGNIWLQGKADISLDDLEDGILLFWDATNNKWFDTISRGLVQVKNTQTGAFATGATIIPLDDTIPQITEGDEYMTCSITPRSVTNILIIQIVTNYSHSVADVWITTALFKDAVTDALAVTNQNVPDYANVHRSSSLVYKTVAGTTSEITFRVRLGGNVAGSLMLNGRGGGRQLGGVFLSSITITEVSA